LNRIILKKNWKILIWTLDYKLGLQMRQKGKFHNLKQNFIKNIKKKGKAELRILRSYWRRSNRTPRRIRRWQRLIVLEFQYWCLFQYKEKFARNGEKTYSVFVELRINSWKAVQWAPTMNKTTWSSCFQYV
jgi:hypothetical protein